MTLPAKCEPLGNKLPSANDRQIANQLRSILAAQKDGETTLYIKEPKTERREITLTPTMSELLLDLLRHVGAGSAVTLVPIQELMTTQQAADLLNVSRPYLIRLLERNAMPYTLVGRHRRIKAEDVFEFKKQRDAKRSEAMDELLAGDSDTL